MPATNSFARGDFIASDGTRLASYSLGPKDAPCLVLAPGLGGGLEVWRQTVAHLQTRLRVLTWDYRGLYQSDAPEDARRYTVSDHARDLMALLDHERITNPVLGGWSMGVQVCLQLHRFSPGISRGLLAFFGAPGNILSTTPSGGLGVDVLERHSATLIDLVKRFGSTALRPGPWIAGKGWVVEAARKWCIARGLVSADIDRELFSEMAQGWVTLDMEAYASIFESLGEHDAEDFLPNVSVPTLVVGGAADPLGPITQSRRLVGLLPQAELFEIEDASHFGLMEYPEQIARRVDEFLSARVSL